MDKMLVFLVLILVFLALRVPVYIALVTSAIALGVLTMGNAYLPFIVQKMFTGVNSYTLRAIPLFMLTGELMNSGGLSGRLIDFANCLVGWIHGGLGFVCIVTCCFLAAILGSSSACAAMVGAVLVPAMVNRGYDDNFAGAVVAGSGCVGPIIPPSSSALIYAVAAEQSVNKLFVGGYVPGAMIAISFMVYTYFVARKRNYPAEPKPTVKCFATALKDAIIPLLLSIIIMGGILGGFFTATEAAAVAVLYCFIVSCFVYKTINLKNIPTLLKKAATGSCIVLAVMTTASFLGYVLTLSRIPQTAAAAISAVTDSRVIFLLMVNVILIIAGCFLDASSAIVILTPVLLPACIAFNVDLVFFGVMMTVNLMIGVLTPPVGLNLYVVSSVAKIDILQLAKASIPFMLMLFGVVLIMVFFPGIVTFLPNILA
jgi:C4-dicarboxylate transporter DctM subunit